MFIIVILFVSSQVIVMACREFEMGRVSVHIFAHVKSQLLFFFLIKKCLWKEAM